MASSLELTGKIKEVLPVRKGVSKNGSWKKQQFILKPLFQENQEPLCFTLWGKNVEEIAMETGNMVEVLSDVYSFKQQNKWYTELKAWKVKNLKRYVDLGDNSKNNSECFDIDGKVKELTNIQTGKSSRGTWRRRQLIIETFGNFKKQVSFNIWNDNIENIKPDIGEEINVVFTIASQKYNNSWYTHLNMMDFGESKTEIIRISL